MLAFKIQVSDILRIELDSKPNSLSIEIFGTLLYVRFERPCWRFSYFKHPGGQLGFWEFYLPGLAIHV
jgi:hypothetical protein